MTRTPRTTRSNRSATRLLPPLIAALALFAIAAPAVPADVGTRDWGLRLGVADDPDQVILGVQARLVSFTRNVVLRPSLDLGFGDDHTLLGLTLPALYRWTESPDFTPYLGGGIGLTFIDRDRPPRRKDDSELEIHPAVLGGVEWPRARGDLFLELGLGFGEAHDLKLVLGWIKRR